MEAGTVTPPEGAPAAEPEELETPTPTEEPEASPETVEGGEAEEGKPEGHQKPANERIQELANKSRQLEEKLAAQEAANKELAAKFEETRKASQAPAPIDERALADYLTDAETQIETLKYEGKVLEAKLLQRKVDKLLDDVEAHKQRVTEWEKTATVQQTTERQAQEALKALDDAARFFAEHKKIPAEVMEKGAAQWAEMRRADPLLDRQYAEVWQRQGEIAAIQFAYEHVTKTQEADAAKLKAEKEKKDTGKVGLGSGASAPKGIQSWQQLMGLGSKQVEAYKKSNPKHYQQLLDKHIN